MTATHLPPAPCLSVLLPTHNRADVLPFAIRSVLTQTFSDFELLIVGDGCTDQTAEVVGSFDDPRISWFDLPKAPHFGYANRNIALRQARGEIIAYMTHDDLLLPDHFAHILAPFAAPEIELVYSRPLWLDPDGLLAPSAFNLHHPATLRSFLSHTWNHIPSACVAHRRECLRRYGYWDETLAREGDWDLWTRIIAGGGETNFAYVPEPTSLHFRAIWRTEPNAGPPEFQIWRQVRERQDIEFSPPSLPIGDGQTQQGAVWEQLAADPAGWTRQLRREIHEALDWSTAQAYTSLVSIDRERAIGELEARIRQLMDANASYAAQIAALHREILNKAHYIERIEEHPLVKLYRRTRRALSR